MKLHTLSIALLCATITPHVYSMDNDPKKPDAPAGAPVLPHILNTPDASGRGPLHIIVTNESYSDEQRVKWIEKFVRHGADINLPIVATSLNYPTCTPLHMAVHFKASPLVFAALLKHGANMRALDKEQRTPIALAAGCAYEDQLESLISHIPDQELVNLPVLPKQ